MGLSTSKDVWHRPPRPLVSSLKHLKYDGTSKAPESLVPLLCLEPECQTLADGSPSSGFQGCALSCQAQHIQEKTSEHVSSISIVYCAQVVLGRAPLTD